MPAIEAPPAPAPAAAPKVDSSSSDAFKGANPGIEKSPLFAALDQHLDPKNKAAAAPAPAAQPPTPPKTEAAKVEVPATDPLSSLVGESEAPEPQRDKKAPDVDFTDFDKEFPDTAPKDDPKANERWKAVKHSAKEAKREAARLATEKADIERQLGELRKNASASDPDVKVLRSQIEEYEKRDAVFKLENDPKFQEKVLQPLMEADKTVRALIAHYKIDGAKLDTAMQKADPIERNEAISKIIADADMPTVNQELFTKSLGAVQDLDFARSNAYQKAQELTQSAQAELKQREDSAKQKRTEGMEAADTEVFDQLSTKADVYKDILKDDATALDIRKKVTAWRNTPEADRDPKLVAYHEYAGFLLKPAQTKIKALEAELKTYKERLKEEVGSEAPAGSGAPRVERGTPEKKLAPGEGVGRAVEEWAAGRR